jgi:hypothetical protein
MTLMNESDRPPQVFSQQLAGTAWAGLKAFAIAFFSLTATGTVLAIISFFVLDSHSRWAAAIAAVVAVFEGIVTGALLGSRHATAAAAAHALGHLRLGGAAVRFVFERLLGVRDQMEPGDRGARLVEAGRKMPLAEAERLVTEKMDDLSKTAPAPGWLATKIRSKVLRAVEAITLSRFREADAQEGGVDLMRLKTELEATIDERLAAKFKSSLTLWTIVAVVGLPATVAAQTGFLLLRLRSHGW